MTRKIMLTLTLAGVVWRLLRHLLHRGCGLQDLQHPQPQPRSSDRRLGFSGHRDRLDDDRDDGVGRKRERKRKRRPLMERVSSSLLRIGQSLPSMDFDSSLIAQVI